MPFGYYDDGFTSKTLPQTPWPGTNRSSPELTYMLNQEYVAGATNHWRLYPYGGESYYAQGLCIFSNPACVVGIQTWSNCVVASHATFIGEISAWYTNTYGGQGSEHYTNSLTGARQLGYEFYAQSCSFWTNGTSLTLSATITNTGVAPFYYPWTVQLLATNTTAHTSAMTNTSWDITTIVPGDGSQTFTATLTNPPAKPYVLTMRVVNPMVSGKQLKFANANQDATITNWVTLGALDSNSDLSPPTALSITSLSLGKAIFGP